MSLPPLPGMGATTKEENYDKITAWANAVGALAKGSVQKTDYSGIRDVSSLLENEWTGTLYMWRSGYDVVFIVNGINGIDATSSTFFTPPTGFGYVAQSVTSTLAHTAANSPTVRRFSTPGAKSFSLAASDYKSIGAVYGRIDARTNSVWPTTLPGTAIGGLPSL